MNEEIVLSMHTNEDVFSSILLVSDNDSSDSPPVWLNLYGLVDGEDVSINLTYEEASKLRELINYHLEVWDENH